MKNSFAILVLSCDKYSSLWKPFFTQFYKHWNTCPYPIYLGSNTKLFNSVFGIKTLLSGPQKDWSNSVIALLNQIKEEYIFVWLDDIFLTKDIDYELFQKCVQFQYKESANHIHFAPSPPYSEINKNQLFGIYEKGLPYRASTVGFWKRDHLKQLLLPGENPWQFEIFGSYRSSYSDGFFCLKKNLFSFIQIVERGKISNVAYKYCSRHNIELNLNGWQIQTTFNSFIRDCKKFIFNIIIHLPWRMRLSGMNMLRSMFASY